MTRYRSSGGAEYAAFTEQCEAFQLAGPGQRGRPDIGSGSGFGFGFDIGIGIGSPDAAGTPEVCLSGL
ncbi:hypothetical protein ACIOGX_00915 [Streptomyces sp. NPDC088147]|uniref:hypothetical protein n=1 Tax=Streptomyces sp. NPDC088147 TaxID=3365830 RepID=UPI00382DC2FD